MKSGYKTSEFWVTLVTLVIPVLIHTGLLSTDQGQQVGETVTGFIVELFDLLAIIVPASYVVSRSYLKSKQS